jgi:hypothetical protein
VEHHQIAPVIAIAMSTEKKETGRTCERRQAMYFKRVPQCIRDELQALKEQAIIGTQTLKDLHEELCDLSTVPSIADTDDSKGSVESPQVSLQNLECLKLPKKPKRAPLVRAKTIRPQALFQSHPKEVEEEWLQQQLSGTTSPMNSSTKFTMENGQNIHPTTKTIVEQALVLMDSAMEQDRLIKHLQDQITDENVDEEGIY